MAGLGSPDMCSGSQSDDRHVALESAPHNRRLTMRTLLALVLAAPLTLLAQAHSHVGHDHDHGAADLGNIGKAHIETSCGEAAQKEIDRGVALIHSFWYAEAEKAFRRAAAAEADCGMAWWVGAMSN